jgi:hypothetical protein
MHVSEPPQETVTNAESTTEETFVLDFLSLSDIGPAQTSGPDVRTKALALPRQEYGLPQEPHHD